MNRCGECNPALLCGICRVASANCRHNPGKYCLHGVQRGRTGDWEKWACEECARSAGECSCCLLTVGAHA